MLEKRTFIVTLQNGITKTIQYNRKKLEVKL